MSRAEHCQSEQGSLCPEPSTGSPLRPKEKSHSLGGGRGSPWPGPRPSPGQTPARSFHPWNTQLFPASGPLHWLVPLLADRYQVASFLSATPRAPVTSLEQQLLAPGLKQPSQPVSVTWASFIFCKVLFAF